MRGDSLETSGPSESGAADTSGHILNRNPSRNIDVYSGANSHGSPVAGIDSQIFALSAIAVGLIAAVVISLVFRHRGKTQQLLMVVPSVLISAAVVGGVVGFISIQQGWSLGWISDFLIDPGMPFFILIAIFGALLHSSFGLISLTTLFLHLLLPALIIALCIRLGIKISRPFYFIFTFLGAAVIFLAVFINVAKISYASSFQPISEDYIEPALGPPVSFFPGVDGDMDAKDFITELDSTQQSWAWVQNLDFERRERFPSIDCMNCPPMIYRTILVHKYHWGQFSGWLMLSFFNRRVYAARFGIDASDTRSADWGLAPDGRPLVRYAYSGYTSHDPETMARIAALGDYLYSTQWDPKTLGNPNAMDQMYSPHPTFSGALLRMYGGQFGRPGVFYSTSDVEWSDPRLLAEEKVDDAKWPRPNDGP
jgi:hypothetical protein